MQHPITALALAAALLVPAAAQAHDIWLARQHGEYAVMHGHEESNNDSYNPDSVTEARAYKNGKPVVATIARHHRQRYATVGAEDAPGLIAATLDSGYWVKTKDGKWHNKMKSEMPAGAEIDMSLYSTKSAAFYLNAREPVTRLGYGLEMVPSVNPAKLKKGEPLSVQVFWHGKPLAGATIKTDIFNPAAEKVTTDAKGNATFAVPRDGFNAVAVSHMDAYADAKKADKIGVLYTLNFKTASDGGNH